MKSRDSLHLLGPQKFKMPDLGGRTLTVYPQVHSWFTRYATVNPCRPAPAAPLLIGATDPDLRVALASSALKSLQDQASELGRLPHPIAVALAGEVNTYKVTMAKAFLRAGLHGPVDPGTRGAIILGRIPSGFEPITSGGRVSDGQKKVEGELDGHPALLLTEGFLLPEEALTYVHNWIGERQHKPDRIAVIGLGDLGSSYPLIMQHVAQRGPFITALLRCFRAHGAHAMFVCTTDGEDSQKVFEQVRSICDGIVETKRDDDGTVSAIYYGTGAREPERITLSRRRSFVRRPGRRRCAIRRTPDHRT